MKMKLHTKGIKGSGLVDPGEEPSVLLGVIVELDGEILVTAYKVEMWLSEDFVTAKILLHPSSVEVVAHDKDSWAQFDERLEANWAAKTSRSGMGRAVARHPEEDA